MEFEKLQKIIAKAMSVDASRITEETSFYDDLGADSLEVFQIIMDAEGEFDIIIDENDINKIETVKDLIEIIGDVP